MAAVFAVSSLEGLAFVGQVSCLPATGPVSPPNDSLKTNCLKLSFRVCDLLMASCLTNDKILGTLMTLHTKPVYCQHDTQSSFQKKKVITLLWLDWNHRSRHGDLFMLLMRMTKIIFLHCLHPLAHLLKTTHRTVQKWSSRSFGTLAKVVLRQELFRQSERCHWFPSPAFSFVHYKSWLAWFWWNILGRDSEPKRKKKS